MLSDYGFVISRGEFGFKNFIKYGMYDVELTLVDFESVGLQNKTYDPDKIAIAKRIKHLYEEFKVVFPQLDKNDCSAIT